MLTDSQRTKRSRRTPKPLQRGGSTAVGAVASYRIGKLRERGILRGAWLDCGCGTGGYTTTMLSLGASRVIGIDVEAERVLRAQHNQASKLALYFCCGVSEALPFQDASFEGVFLNEVLEHVEDEDVTLREIYRVLRPGGVLALMSPNRWFPIEGHGIRVKGKPISSFAVPMFPWLPSRLTAPFQEARNYWPQELRNLVCDAGFEIISSSTVWPMFEVHRLLPRYILPLYRRVVPILEQLPMIRNFGVSNFILAQRPQDSVGRTKPLK